MIPRIEFLKSEIERLQKHIDSCIKSSLFSQADRYLSEQLGRKDELVLEMRRIKPVEAM